MSDIPAQKDRVIAVTGARGLGYLTTKFLAAAGAEVILMGRSKERGEAAVEKIRTETKSEKVRFELLDLADLASVEACAKRMNDKYPKLDVLVNNAAEIMISKRQQTKDGFELHFGTNHLAHFALTGRLMPLLRKGNEPRVINVSAIAASNGVINFDDLQLQRKYSPMYAYGVSKLANLLFSFELQRRSETEKWGISSIAAHPGFADVSVVDCGTDRKTQVSFFVRLLMKIIFQQAERGVLPILFAATSPEAIAGQYYAPNGIKEIRGFPALAKIPSQAKDEGTAKRLWEVSKQLTSVDFDDLANTCRIS